MLPPWIRRRSTHRCKADSAQSRARAYQSTNSPISSYVEHTDVQERLAPHQVVARVDAGSVRPGTHRQPLRPAAFVEVLDQAEDAVDSGFSLSRRVCRRSLSGSQTSSASRKAMRSPLPAATPSLREAGSPRCSRLMQRTMPPKPRAIAALLSARAVIDDDDFTGRQVLSQHAFDGLPQKGRTVEDGDDDADRRAAQGRGSQRRAHQRLPDGREPDLIPRTRRVRSQVPLVRALVRRGLRRRRRR